MRFTATSFLSLSVLLAAAGAYANPFSSAALKHGFPAGESAQPTEDETVTFIASKVDTAGAGVPVVVFNSLSWKRTGPVEVESPFDVEITKGVTVTDGKSHYPAQLVADRIVFTGRDIPANGYKVFWLEESPRREKGTIRTGPDIMENEFFIVRLDSKVGAIAGIYDKRLKRELVSSTKHAGLFEISRQERQEPRSGSGRVYHLKYLDVAKESEIIESGPVRAVARLDHEHDDCQLVQDVVIYESLPRIDLRMVVDWKETTTNEKYATLLGVIFPTSFTQVLPAVETLDGSVEDPSNIGPTTVPKWIDVSAGGSGVAILSSGDFGRNVSVSGSEVRLTLIGSQDDPSRASGGIHQIICSIFPHKGTWSDADLPRHVLELKIPLRGIRTESHEGPLPNEMAF